MINVNFTLLVQLANFLILMVILNYLLFKPILRVIDERNRLIGDASEIKERLGQLADESIGKYERKILTAKQEAMRIRGVARSEGLGQYRQKVEEAREAGHEQVEGARKELVKEAVAVRETLMADTGTLASAIAARLLGRKVGGDA